MTNIPLDLYRACKASAWGKNTSQRQKNFIQQEGTGSLHPEYEGFERGDGTFRAPDVTTFKDTNDVIWIRGVNDRNQSNNPYVSWKEGTSLSGTPGCFGYGGWFYFLLPKDTPIPASLDVKHTPSRRDPNLDFSPFSIKVVETTDIDAVHVRGRTGIAKWMNAAVFTEPVFGCFRPELIERQRILPREQLEALRRNTMMQGPLLCTDGTVAFNGLSEVGFDLKPNLATMTTTLIRSHDQL